MGLWSGYRFGFNGMEKDDEVKGSGNSYDFGARIYDSRVGRWGSTDAKASIYTGLSPYANCANNPIFNTDHLGDEIIPWFKVKNFLGVGWTKYNSNMGWNSVKLEKSFICFHDSFKEMRYVNINYQTY